MIKAFLRQENGMGLLIVLAFIGLAVPLVTGALGLASTLSIESRIETRILKDQYSAIGGSQYATYRMVYESGYVDTLQVGIEDTFTLNLNGGSVSITVIKISDPSGDTPPPGSDSSRRLQALKSVNPTNASPSQPSTFTYTITVGNQDDEPENLKKIYDGLPVGFSYVTGSTTGVTTNDPSINIYQSESGGTTYEQLTWNLAQLGITLQPSEVASLTFNATATAPQGVYCNEVWVDPGGQKTSSGPTAKITVGSPSNTLCGGEAVSVTKTVVPRLTPSDTLTTYTYTITIDNIGTASLGMSQLRDLLPAGFSYKVGSTSGDITLVDPHNTLFQGRERLDWDFSPSYSIPSGVIKTVSFDVEAQVAAGDYWNEVWATFDELTYSAYTWPTSSIEVMGVLKSSATGGDTLVYAEVWVGTSSYIVDQWELNR